MALDERDFFNNRNETRTDKLTCPRCKRINDYQMRWVVRTKKDRLPPGADERDRALYAKLRNYMIRVDDAVTCKTCGKKFDIPSQHSMVFIDERGAAPLGRRRRRSTRIRASIDERHDPPSDGPRVARVVVAEAAPAAIAPRTEPPATRYSVEITANARRSPVMCGVAKTASTQPR